MFPNKPSIPSRPKCRQKPRAIPPVAILQRNCRRFEIFPTWRLPWIVPVLLVALLLAETAGIAVTLTPEELALARRMSGTNGQHRSHSRLSIDPVLTAVARARAADMARRRYFSHVNPDGNGPDHLMRAAGYPLPAFWGTDRTRNSVESIAAGYNSADEVWDAWMHSQSHRSHLLAAQPFFRNQTKVGIGYYYDESSPYRRYWVILTAPPARGRVASAGWERNRSNAVRIAVVVPAWTSAR
jgi:hypothetical protein